MKRHLLVLLCFCSLAVACWGQDPNASVVQGSATGTTLPVTGTLTADQGAAGIAAWLVNIMNWPATFGVTQSTSPWIVGFGGTGQPVTQSGAWSIGQTGTWNVGLSAGSNTIGKVDQGTGGASAWKVDGSAVTQPISGTVTAAGLTTGTPANAFSAPGAILQSQMFPQIFNGSAWDLVVAANAASNTTGTGLLGVGLLGFDGTNWQRLKINSSSVPVLQTTLVSTSGQAASLAIVGDGTTAASGLFVNSQPFVWNGTQYDRTRSATAAANTTGTGLAGSGLLGYDGANWQYVGINGSHGLKMDGSAVTQPVSGTFWQATQPVSGTFWQATQPVSGTFWQATQPVSATSLPLPTGAATEATLATLPLAQGSTTSGQSGPLAQGAVTTAAPSYTTAKTSPLSLNTSGGLRVDGSAVTQPVSGTVTANQGGTWTVQPGNTANTTAWKVDGSAVTQPVSGTFWQATQPVSGTVTANAGSGTFAVDGSGHTQPVSGTFWQATQPVSGTVTANQGGAPWSAVGTLTNNNAAPSTNNVGALTAKATAAIPGWTEGNQVALSSDLSGGLRTLAQGLVSSANSSTVALGISATFTGTGEDVSNYATIGVYCVSTHPGGVPVLHAEFSNDNSNWDLDENTTLVSNVAIYRTYAVKGRYFRLVLNNGTSAESALRLQAIYHQNPVPKGQFTNDALLVDGSAVTQPVSGTFWQATQPVSGTVTANAGTGNFATNVAQVNGSTVVTSATGVQKVGVVGNAGATVDSTVGAGTAPTNQIVTGAIYNTTAPAPTNGQAMALQADQAGNQLTAPGIATAALSAWNSATALNATQNIFTHSGVSSVLVHLVQTTTLSAGAITFEVTYDNSNWITIPADCVIDPTSAAITFVSLPYTVQASTNKGFLLLMRGAQGLRIKLSTQITGTGSVTPNYALLAYNPVQQVTGHVSLGSNAGKTNHFDVGSLTTTSASAGQGVLSEILGANTTFYISSIELSAGLTAVSATGSILGTMTVSIGGSSAFTETFTNPTTEQRDRIVLNFAEPIAAAGNTTLTVTCTPTSTTSMFWRANIIGYSVNGIGF